MLQLINETPFAPAMFLFPDEEGVDTLYVAVKATFEVSSDQPPAIAAEQHPVVLADEYWGEPGKSSLKRASEAHLMKPGTDVVVVGDAMAPEGKPVTRLDVSLTVADRSSTLRVWGDREWRGTGLKAWPGDPAPFDRMPVVYERAFGGMQEIEKSDGTVEIHAEPFNPVGRGLKGKRPFSEIREEPVPNIEDPALPVSSPTDKGRPVGFGFVAPWWAPRMSLAGTYDERWQKTRAPYLPEDFDPRFFHTAASGWVFDEGLEGGETVSVEHMSPSGWLSFGVPSVPLLVEVTVDGRTESPPLRLETLLVEPNDGRFCLTWRAAVRCDKKALAINQVRILG